MLPICVLFIPYRLGILSLRPHVAAVRRFDMRPRNQYFAQPAKRLLISCGTSAVLCASVFSMSGCTTIPTPEEIEVQTDSVIQTINRVMDEEVARCNGDQACINSVNQIRHSLIEKAISARIEALQENWRTARERRQELERELLELIPNFPDLKPALDLIYNSSVESTTTFDFDVSGDPILGIFSSGSSGSSQSGTPNVFTMLTDAATALINLPDILPESDLEQILLNLDEPAIGYLYEDNDQVWARLSIIRKLRFTGTATVSIPNSSLTGNLTLNLFVQESLAQDGSYYATINSGNGSWNSSSLNATVAIEPLGSNFIHIPDGGSGIVTALMSINYSSDAWGSILPRYQTFHIPITRSGDHFEFTDQITGLHQFTPHCEHPSSDYNRDGILDYSTDYPAFLMGASSHETLADMNHDDTWDSADISAWAAVFMADYNARNAQ